MSEDSDVSEFTNRGEFITNKGERTQHLPGPNDKVYDLVDSIDEYPKKIHSLTDIVKESESFINRESLEVLLVDGRGYEKKAQPEEKIYDLVDIVEEKPVPEQAQEFSPEEMRKIIVETVERMARDMIPDIAERVIKEEIEKLKQESEEEIS